MLSISELLVIAVGSMDCLLLDQMLGSCEMSYDRDEEKS